MGEVLSSLYGSPASKLTVVIPKGKIRPASAAIAAKFATECYKTVKFHVLVRCHWRKYKRDANLLSDYYQKVGEKFDMDINASPIKAACRRYLQIGVKHQRHVLKTKYFDGRPLSDVPKESPVSSMNDAEWNELVQHWMDPKMKEISDKNRGNRANVLLHHTTGARSYVAHLENLVTQDF